MWWLSVWAAGASWYHAYMGIQLMGLLVPCELTCCVGLLGGAAACMQCVVVVWMGCASMVHVNAACLLCTIITIISDYHVVCVAE